jgi:hypothetical protein
MMDFNFQICYKKGIEMLADFLLREHSEKRVHKLLYGPFSLRKDLMYSAHRDLLYFCMLQIMTAELPQGFKYEEDIKRHQQEYLKCQGTKPPKFPMET